MTEAIEEVIFPALGLVFLLLGIVLIASIIFTSFSPYDQIAFANAEKVSAAINEACFTPGRAVELNSIELRQNTPSFTWIFTILPRWLIRVNGDPNYVMYYEAFPPGEATGWEVYNDFQNRLFAPLPDIDPIDNRPFDGKSGREVSAYALRVLQNFKQRNPGQRVDEVIVNNILLSESFRSDFMVKTEKSGTGGGVTDMWEVGGPSSGGEPSSTEKFFSYGKWKTQDLNTKIPSGKNQFIFSNYASLTDLEKTSIKYQPCGENSLCLRTRSGVYSFPLDYCKNIKNIQLFYHGGDTTTFGETVWDLTEFVGGIFVAVKSKIGGLLGLAVDAAAVGIAYDGAKDLTSNAIQYKAGDFYLASPCSIVDDNPGDGEDITVESTSCSDSICVSAIEYPMYTYNAESGTLKKLGKNHYVCTQNIGTKIDTPPSNPISGNCIKVNIEYRKKYYCWTPAPYSATLGEAALNVFFGRTIGSTPPITTLLRGFQVDSIRLIYGLPINKNNDFLAASGTVGNVILSKPTETTLKQGEDFLGAVDRKWWWGWP
ncbi:MAG: hypothetical protein NT120_02375 [Candidatus Aenigmarchaeota archaeon]|nr:hypothetical protein [Candidatus Aenigmarchaeota archaeon]